MITTRNQPTKTTTKIAKATKNSNRRDGPRPLSDFQLQRRTELELVIINNLVSGKFFLVAGALCCLNDEALYVPERNIYVYSKERFGFSRRTTNTYLCSAQVFQSIAEDPSLPLPGNISHVRSLYQFSPEVRREIWRKLIYEDQTITEERVLAMTVQYQSGIRFNNISNEVYAPYQLIDLAHEMIGGIFDLDPASSEHANNLNNAKLAHHYFDENHDGLKQKWHGNVWLFPPFSDKETHKVLDWFATAEWKYLSGEIRSCFCLLKVEFYTELIYRTFYYPHLILKDAPVFQTPSGKEKTFGSTPFILVYLGPDVAKFCELFESVGFLPGVNTWSNMIAPKPIRNTLPLSTRPMISFPPMPMPTPMPTPLLPFLPSATNETDGNPPIQMANYFMPENGMITAQNTVPLHTI